MKTEESQKRDKNVCIVIGSVFQLRCHKIKRAGHKLHNVNVVTFEQRVLQT